MRSWLKKSKVRKMSIAERAWLAGFIDGEGTIMYYCSGRFKQYPTWFLQVPNTHVGSLEHCQRIVGTGNIIRKREARGNWKAQWQWRVNPQRELASIFKQILPYLVIKKQQAQAFLDSFVDLKT